MEKFRLKLSGKGRARIFFLRPLLFSLIFPIASIAVFYFDKSAGLIYLSAAVLFYAAFFAFSYSKRQELYSILEDTAIAISESQGEVLRSMPQPFLIIDMDGKILWKNQSFSEIQEGAFSKETELFSIFPNLHREMLPEGDTVAEIHSEYGGRKYLLSLFRSMDVFSEEAEEILKPGSCAVFVTDETEVEGLRSKLSGDRLVQGLIYIDNYEEVLDRTEEVKKSLLNALIDRKISRYLQSVGGIEKKLEKDKYFFILKYHAFERLVDDRFSILEEVKQINIGEDASLTLSIGVGYGNDSYQHDYDYARVSIDMALGRGGDQAVVRSPEGVRYFGGKSNTQEKYTRVKARVKAQAFQEILENRDKVLIMGHRNSDVDCLGAAAGIYRMAVSFGKRAYIVQNTFTSTIIPLKKRFIESGDYPEDLFVTGKRALEIADQGTVLVIVDCNRPSILDEPGLLKKCQTKVVFDHHRLSQEVVEGAMLSYCEPYASSASEMVTEMLQYVGDGIRVKSPEADAMYGGIVVDSQEFTNQTGVRTFEAAAYLRRCGADISRIRKIFRDNYDDCIAKTRAITDARVYKGAYAFGNVKPDGLDSPTVVSAKAANELLEISGIKASFVITKIDETVFISARSIDETNVQVLMERLGGGGHRTVAGAQLKNITESEAEERLKKELDIMIGEEE